MALKALMLRKKIDGAKKQLEALREKDADFEKREAELEAAVEEAETDEEKTTVEEEIEAFETEKLGHETAKANLETEVSGLETELEKLENEQPAPNPKNVGIKERKAEKNMENRTKFFGMSIQERNAFFEHEDVKEFLKRTREAAKERRDVSGAELLIPTVVLGVLRENIEKYSKLMKHINVKPVAGKARQTTMGTVPEAVWMEACGALNELNLLFNQAEVDGYKVGGFISICNATLEDASDVELATEIITALGQAIGLAVDKAILYGTGVKMPMGIVTRLTQTAAPTDYPAKARPWVDLSVSNVISIKEKTDVALFKAIVESSGAAKSAYSFGKKFWAMNEKTHTKLVANALSINATGAIVAGVNGTMPVLGGEIEELSFIPDGVIIGGYGDVYLLAERAGTNIARSEHAKFIEDQTVFKGTARYDGMPVIAEDFVVMDINGGTVSASAVTFAEDKAKNAG